MRRLSFLFSRFVVVLLGLPAQSQTQLPPDVREKIDKLATDANQTLAAHTVEVQTGKLEQYVIEQE